MGTLPHRRLGLLLLFACAVLCDGVNGRELVQKEDDVSPPSGFLEDEVPLTVVTTSPEKLLTGGRIEVEGREALTVVLSRPVLPPGQEVDKATLEEMKPFFLEPEVAGEYRWLTTYIAVFQPAEEWASDLEVDFEWNTDLATYDGVPLSARAGSRTRITTPALDLRAVAVTSEEANALTDNFWDAFAGTSYDFLPEVPGDASIRVLASSPINLEVLQKSLLITDPLTNANPQVSISVSECELPEIPCVECFPEVGAEDRRPNQPEEDKDPEYGGDYFYGAEEEAEPEDPVVTAAEPDSPVVLKGKSSSCLEISFSHDNDNRPSFLQGRRYSIVMPAETQYSNDAGPLTRDISIDFAGLRDFRVPFVEDSNFNISSSRLLMWIPHGLGEGLNISDLPMKIVRAKTGEDVDFALETVSKSVIRVDANFNPDSTYKINVFESPNFKDGYDLSLKRSNLNFLAEPIEPFFGAMNVATDIPLAIFEEDQDWGEKIVIFSKGSPISDNRVCRKEASSISLWDISGPEEALQLLSPSPLDKPVVDILGVAADRLVDERTDIAGDTNEIAISKLLERTGVVASSYCRDDQHFPLVVCQTQLQVVVLITSALTAKGRQALVWVTNMKTAAPVVDAAVTLYAPQDEVNITHISNALTLFLQNDFESVSDGETDKNGVAAVTLDRDIQQLHAAVTFKGKSVYVPYVAVQNGVASAISDSIILDRPVVRPGESLNIKGYIMQKDGGEFLPTKVKKVRVVVSPSMLSRSKESDTLDVDTYDAEFGSYTLSMRIPFGISPVDHSIRVEADLPSGGDYVGKPEPFYVLDPRRSPALLTISGPDWALPDKKVKVQAGVTSFAGAPIQDANLVFSWRIDDEARDEDDERLTGLVFASTNGDGEASANIDLSKFQNSPSPGTTLTVVVRYTGSSGERVERSTTVRLEAADVEIVLEKTLETDIPLQKFGIRAKIFNFQGKQLNSGSLSYALKEISAFRENGRPTLKPTTATSEMPGKAAQKCERSFKSSEFCEFELPKMGEYVLEACTKIAKSKVCKRSYMGKTKAAWDRTPLETHLPMGIIPMTTGPYTVGKEAAFTVENPYEDAKILMAWGSTDQVKTSIHNLKRGRQTLKFKIDSICSANCALSLTTVVPRQKKGLVNDLAVPVNAVFDPAMPHTEQYATVIETQRKKATLDMKVSLPNIKTIDGMPLIEPGINASVRVSFDRKTPVEITAFAIDTAILELLPYPLKDVSDDFAADLSDYFRYKSSAENMVAPGAIEAISKANQARKKLDSWFSIISTLQPSENNADIQLTDEEYLEKYVQYLTVHPRSPEEMAMAATQLYDVSEREKEEEDSATEVTREASLAVQPNYVLPGLFESFTASGGVWLVNFEGPVEGGEYVIRAYASSGTGLFGNDEVRVKVKRSIDIRHDFPSFARLGDEFEAGMTISLLEQAEKSVSVKFELSENLEMSGPDTLILQMGKDLEREIRVNFKTAGVGEASIRVVADDGVGHDVKLNIRLTIHGPQRPVVIGSAFPVSGAVGQEPSLEMVIPDALEGSGSVVVSAGIGHISGILLLADEIYSQDSFTCPISADFVVANVAIPAIVDTYYPWSPDPNLLPEFYVNLINGMLSSYQKALTTIYEDSTSSTLGLGTEVPCPGNSMSRMTTISLEQNAKGIFIINEVEKRLREHNLEDIHKNTAAVFTARKTWIGVLEEGLVDAATAARAGGGQIDHTTVAMARLALGPSWEPPKGTPAQIVSDLSMDRLKKDFNSMSVESQAYYTLAHLSAKKPDKAEVKKALDSWAAKIASSGDRAYVATKKGTVTADSNLANALAFMAMVRGGAKAETLRRMAYYVTAPTSDIYGFNEYSIFAKTVAMLGLADYDATLKGLKSNLRIEIRSGTIILFSASFTPGRHPVSAQETNWEDLDDDAAPVQVFPQGDGEVNVAIAMKYVPRDPLENPIYKGIYVDRIIQLDSAGAISEAVTTVPVGTVVNVKVYYMTPVDLDKTTVQVFLPAGLEPVQLGGEGEEFCPVPFFDLFNDEVYQSCPEQVTNADYVEFVYEGVSAGAHAVAFKAVAAISGSFGIPPARVYVTETPTIMGMSSAARLDICKTSDKKCTTEAAPREFIAKECKNNCNGNGVCDLSSGKCNCFQGFGGDDCQKVGAA